MKSTKAFFKAVNEIISSNVVIMENILKRIKDKERLEKDMNERLGVLERKIKMKSNDLENVKEEMSEIEKKIKSLEDLENELSKVVANLDLKLDERGKR